MGFETATIHPPLLTHLAPDSQTSVRVSLRDAKVLATKLEPMRGLVGRKRLRLVIIGDLPLQSSDWVAMDCAASL